MCVIFLAVTTSQCQAQSSNAEPMTTMQSSFFPASTTLCSTDIEKTQGRACMMFTAISSKSTLTPQPTATNVIHEGKSLAKILIPVLVTGGICSFIAFICVLMLVACVKRKKYSPPKSNHAEARYLPNSTDFSESDRNIVRSLSEHLLVRKVIQLFM